VSEGHEHGEACITCGDLAAQLRVVSLDSERELALCEDGAGRRETVEVALVAPVEVGDELLVHAGTAIARPGAPR
jgi:hydrogenase maturation factor